MESLMLKITAITHVGLGVVSQNALVQDLNLRMRSRSQFDPATDKMNAVDSGGYPASIHHALDPIMLPVLDIQEAKKNKCQLTRTPYGRRFANKREVLLKFMIRMDGNSTIYYMLNDYGICYEMEDIEKTLGFGKKELTDSHEFLVQLKIGARYRAPLMDKQQPNHCNSCEKGGFKTK
uniref:Uncharacterized protein n=1 Tax=Oryza brachyantha TaxID=4533 RepID=J3MVU8_ORYBR